MAAVEWRGGGRGGGRGGRRSSGPASASTPRALGTEDVVMSDGGGTGADRRGGKRNRGGRTSTPYSAASRPALNAIRAATEGGPPRRARSASPGRSSSTRDRDGPSGSKTGKTPILEALGAFLVTRWQPQTGLLDLSKLRDSEILKERNVRVFGQTGCPNNFGKVLWTVASSTCQGIVSISLASNNLKLLQMLDFRELVERIPSLQNLSLQDNNIASVSELNPLSSTVPQTLTNTGLTNLREIILTGNPVARSVPGTPEHEVYRRAVLRRFPTISQLDGSPIEPLVSPIPPAIRGATSSASQIQFPIACQPGLTDKAEHRQVVTAFLIKYLGLYDTARNQLADAYAGHATFSMSCNASTTDRARVLGVQAIASGGHKIKWNEWMQQSRNLKRMVGKAGGAPEKRYNYFHTGQAAIVKALTSLPASNHPLDKADNFVFDLYAIPGLVDGTADGLMVTVHGEMVETEAKGDGTLRSFSRSFILAAPPEGSPSALAGWPCVIISDQFVIRAYCGPASWTPTSFAFRPDVSLDQGQQMTMAAQLAAETGLTQDFALNCLRELGWDLVKARAVVAQVRHQIPAEGWTAGHP